jgi:APA family basic amino acid/polyamine antiporter
MPTRKLGLADSIWIGLGAMLGAGVFAALGPATRAAGPAMLIGVVIAAAVAWCSSRSLPRLDRRWGAGAAWTSLLGKTAALAALALTFGNYVAPDAARSVGVAAIVLLTGVNLLGVERPAWVTRIVVIVVLGALGLAVAGGLLGGHAHAARLTHGGGGFFDVLEAAGFMFFAFAGFTQSTKAVDASIAIVLGACLLTGIAALSALGPRRVGLSAAPLADAVPGEIEPFVRVGAAIAVASVLLWLLADVAQGAYTLVKVEPEVVQIGVAAVAILATLALGARGAIGLSSFALLVHYAIANAWATGSRLVPAVGLAGCVALALGLLL